MIWSFTFVVFFGLADVLWKGVMQRMDSGGDWSSVR